MTSLLGYPSTEPRLVALAGPREPTYLSTLSLRTRARWRFARTGGRWLWAEPPASVARAWDIGVDLLEAHEETMFGVLSEPGSEQRLTLIPDEGERVVKVAVHPSADEVVARERANLLQVRESAWSGLAPRAEGRPETEREALVMERVTGRHPRWDDHVYADLRRALTAGGRLDVEEALFHGDVTPWNTLTADSGGLRLLDWEYADLAHPAHCVCGLLDFALRGAIAARARPARVQPVFDAVLTVAEIGPDEARSVIDLYGRYRQQIREVTTRPDRLSQRAEELLRRCLPA